MICSNRDYVFTSESVTPGHPDKVCDIISDTILDYYLTHDNTSKVACETMFTPDTIIIAGEVKSTFKPTKKDVKKVVKNTLKEIGYGKGSKYGHRDENNKNYKIKVKLIEQSPEINTGVVKNNGEIGAGDQGIMFGFACDETPDYMPYPITAARIITNHFRKYLEDFPDAGLMPDGKSQVTVQYIDGVPSEITDIVVSMQHSKLLGLTLSNARNFYEKLSKDALKLSIDPRLEMVQNTKFHLNPAGEFTIGGSDSDCGLTGRKIIVDTYGGYCPHGGGAFSGKDPTKVDRSGAYMARYIAKNIVAAGVAKMVEIQLSYGIGIVEPISIFIQTKGLKKGIKTTDIEEYVKKNFDCTPKGIIDTLDLCNPDVIEYKKTAMYGHFGNNEFPWEKLDKVQDIQEYFDIKDK